MKRGEFGGMCHYFVYLIILSVPCCTKCLVSDGILKFVALVVMRNLLVK
jgi:hypothetical protein